MGEPTSDEMAAIVAAVELCWPKPVVAAAEPRSRNGNRWRWSGRWWGPLHGVAARQRPWQRV